MLLKGIKLPFLDWRPQKPLELVQAERNLLKATKVHIDSIKVLQFGLGRNSRAGLVCKDHTLAAPGFGQHAHFTRSVHCPDAPRAAAATATIARKMDSSMCLLPHSAVS